MALLWADSCGDYSSTGAFSYSPWASLVNATIVSGGQNGNGIQITPAAGAYGQVGIPNISLLNNSGTGGSIGWGGGVALYVASLSSVNFIPIFQLGQGSTFWYYSFVLSGSTWFLQFSDNAGHVINTPYPLLAAATWFYPELLVSNLQSGAVVTMRVNGTTVATGLTRASIPDNPFINAFIGGPTWTATNAPTTIYDNFYCFSTLTGSGLVSQLLGPQTASVLLPSANGRVNQFTPSAGSNYQNVDSVPPGATYNSSNTVGNIDDYALASLPGGLGQINGVVVLASAENVVSGRTLSVGLGNGTTESFQNTFLPGSSYSYGFSVYDTNPFTSVRFVSGDFSSLQASIKLAS